MVRRWMLLAAAGLAAGCGGAEELACGPGTVEVEDACVPAEGTSCGPGTHAVDGQCIPDGELSCGPGTHVVNGQCVPDGELACGPGTHADNGQCIPDGGVVCGPGTSESNGQCLPTGGSGAPGFYILTAGTEVPADGFTKLPVVVHGIDDTGAPVTEAVTVAPSRADAGTLAPATFTLGGLGGQTFFTPCNSATNPSCLGDFTLQAFLSSDPSTPVATSAPLHLVEPTGVGSPAPCQVSGNVIFFDGDANDYIHPGIDTIVTGQWSASASPMQIHVGVDPSDSSQGLWWDIYLSSEEIGQPLTTQVYEDAERWPFESPGRPGLSVSGDGRGCNTLSGRFQIHELVMNGGSLSSLLATFEQRCEMGSAVLRGCVHYGP